MPLQNFYIQSMKAFLDETYHIPNYQREYSWELTHLEDFWLDLENLIEELKFDLFEQHFFGQILVHSDSNSKLKFIIDGQQRTTTSIIFLRAMLYFYEEIYNNEPISEVKEFALNSISDIKKLIGKKTKNQELLHLYLGETDRQYFKENIQLGYPNNSQKKEKKKSHERIKKAYNFFKDNFERKLINLDNQEKIDLIDKYLNAFTSNFKVMYIEATELDEAFIIFETLNARGKELETSDLLKNHIFSNSPSTIKKSERNWSQMVNDLGQADLTKFIRHYWNSNRKFTREKLLYRTISKEINNPRKSEEFLENLKSFSLIYSSLTHPSENTYFKNSGIQNTLQSLKILNASTFYPVILSLKQLSNFNDLDISKVLLKLESMIFRISIAGLNPNKYEVYFSNLAKNIYDKVFKTTDEIISNISKEIVQDEVFVTNFALWNGSPSSKDLIRYIFRKIHAYLDPNHEINIINTDVHIEHIMPSNIDKWEVSDEIHSAYLWRLGNLALLGGPLNIEISNKPFIEKKEHYFISSIMPNKDLVKYNKWTETEINDRQKFLSEIAVKIWKK